MTIWVNYFDQILIFAVYALSLNLLLGYAGQVSVAHAAFGAIGGYTVVYLATAHGVAYVPGVIVGMAAATLLGVLIALASMRLSEEFLVLLTLALGEVVVGLISSYQWLGGTFGITTDVPPASILGYELQRPEQWVLPLLVIVAATFLVCWRTGESPFGRILKGIREDQRATQALGANTFRAKVIVFSVATALAALAGALYSGYFQLAKPQGFTFTVSIAIFTMVVVGGEANLFGSLVGAALIVLSEPVIERVLDLSPDQVGIVRNILYGALLVVVIMVRPQGLIPEGVRLRRRAVSGVRSRPPASGRARSVGSLADAGGAAATDPPACGAVVLSTSGLSKYFGGIVAAEDLSLDLCAGQITALVGPNGAGKTTVFNLLTGFLTPDRGSVLLNGREIVGKTPDAIARLGVARSFQDVRLLGRLTCLENVTMAVPDNSGESFGRLWVPGAHTGRDEKAAQATALGWLEFVGLDSMAHKLARDVGYGEAKLVALARVLATEAPVLLLDEPASGIDTHWVERMKELIARVRDAGRTVCLVEHNLHVVEALADRAYFMELGRITAEGTIAQLTADPRLGEVYFGGS